MEELFNELLQAAKKDRKLLNKLKHIAVESAKYDLASKLRDIEREVFPESDEVKATKDHAAKLSYVFKMVELNISEDVSWLISETIKVHNEKQGLFSIKDAAELKAKRDSLFL